jgi:DNA polymerase V
MNIGSGIAHRSGGRIAIGARSTQDSRAIVQQVLSLLRPMYLNGYDYAKAGVMLSVLVNATAMQEDLFASPSLGQDDRAARLMSVLDEINRKSPI